MGGKLVAGIAGVGLAVALSVGTAQAQGLSPALVTGVPDGDTLTVRAADGRDLTVRVLGIDAPEPTDCGGRDARAELRELTDGQPVTLTTDPAVEPIDGFGRWWLYVSRPDDLDVGLELVRRGWATVVGDPPFQRLDYYLAAEDAASAGVWERCDGDFHLTRTEQLRELRVSAKAFVRRYYRRLSNDQYRAAWAMLGRPVKRGLGHGFRNWRAGFRGSLGISASATKARLAGDRAIVSVRLRSRDRDVCSGRSVAQRFSGSVSLRRSDDTWEVVRFRVHKTGGRTPRLSKSQCPPPPPPPPAAGPDCQGYDPCLTPGADVDCAGGSGDGPRYVEGPVYVGGNDPYGLDGDGDGVACES